MRLSIYQLSYPGLYPHYLFLYKEILDDLKDHLMFKPYVQALVDQLLVDITIDSYGRETIFIGVHCRRTDFEKHLKVLNSLSLLLLIENLVYPNILK